MIHGFALALLLGREHLLPPQVEKEGAELDEMP
ncbi:preprotein translocase subunit SecF [Vibrio cholerae]|nr:preprotein translocase subunit SecF [Vibrio cholerae]